MESTERRRGGRSRRWLAWSGVAAAIGAVLAIGTPWAQTAVLGTRPYVASAFDLGSLAGWTLMLAGLVGVRVTFGRQFGRFGRAAVGTTAAGMLLLAGLSVRRAVLFAEAGFRAVPATGADPAGLVLSAVTVLGLLFTVAGAGCIGLALRRVPNPPVATARLLLLAPAVPLGVFAFDLAFGLPLAIGRIAVGTDALLVPFGLGWTALGMTVASRARPRR